MKLRSLLPFTLPLLIGCSGSAPIATTSTALPDRVQHATDLGRLAPDTPVDFVVGLALRRPEALHKFVAGRALADMPMQPGDFADTFAPTTQDYGRVVSWLRAHGAFVTRTVAGRTTVSATGRADAVESLFGVELHQYSDADGTFFAAAGPLAVANDLVGVVNGVVGLAGSGGWQPHLAFPDLSAGAALSPSDMHMLYGSASIMNPGMGETVAILGAGNPPDPMADVNYFMGLYKPYGVASTSNYNQVLLGGPTREPSSEASSEFVENVLDAEMVLSMAPLATVQHVIVATNSPGLFTDGVSYIVNQLSTAHAVTVSYGGCERGAAQEMPVLNTLFEQAQAEGQQWFFAAGDSGTDGCRDGSGNMHITAGWPTSSPYVVGVGGTMIGNGGVEVTWNQNSSGGGAGGGGPSEILTKPAYQMMGRTPNDNARDTPDLSAIAGGGGVFIALQLNGKPVKGTVGGTSAAAPICAGAWALVDQGKGGTGIKDALTKIYQVGTMGFNDVTVGDNGGPDDKSAGYPAGPGYDLATGWGTPNVAQLIANMMP